MGLQVQKIPAFLNGRKHPYGPGAPKIKNYSRLPYTNDNLNKDLFTKQPCVQLYFDRNVILENFVHFSLFLL